MTVDNNDQRDTVQGIIDQMRAENVPLTPYNLESRLFFRVGDVIDEEVIVDTYSENIGKEK